MQGALEVVCVLFRHGLFVKGGFVIVVALVTQQNAFLCVLSCKISQTYRKIVYLPARYVGLKE